MTSLILLKDFLETQIEPWRPIVGCRNHEVSNLGRVRSWVTTISVPTGDSRGARFESVRTLSPALMKQSPRMKKWRRITIQGYGTYSVHRLVAQAFIPNPHNYPEVNHLNAIPSDNRAANLEWTDHRGNHAHATKYGLRKRGEGVWHLARLNERDVLTIRELRAKGVGTSELASMFGVARSSIKRVVNGRTWRHVA